MNSSQERLESARAVLKHAAAQLCRADAVLRGESPADSGDATNILEYVERADRPPSPERNRIDRTRPWTRELAALRGRAVKCGLRTGSQTSPLAQVTEDTLSACESMLQELAAGYLESERLRAQVRAEGDAWEHLFASTPVACVAADRNGCILEANPAAGAFLNLGARRLKGRNLLVFSKDRAAFTSVVAEAGNQDGAVAATLTLRPRERKPLRATILVVPPPPDGFGAWLWFLSAEDGATGSALAAGGATSDSTAQPAAIGRSGGCPRCGDTTSSEPHASDADCLDALEDRLHALHAHIADVQERCARLSGRQTPMHSLQAHG